MISDMVSSDNEPWVPECQVSGCQYSNNKLQGDAKYCTDCNLIVCKICLPTHDTSHIFIENIDLTNLPKRQLPQENGIHAKNIVELGNVSPLQFNQNQSNDSKTMISEDTLPDTEEKMLKGDNQSKKKMPDFLNQLNFLQEEDEEDDDSDDDEDGNAVVRMLNINQGTKAGKDDDSDEDSDNDDEMINFTNSKLSSIMNTKMNGMSTTTIIDESVQIFQKSPQDSRGQFVGNNTLQVPKQMIDFSNVNSYIQQPYFKHAFQHFTHPPNNQDSNNFDQNSNMYSNQITLTPVQKLLQQKGNYFHLLNQFYTNKPVPKNIISKKAAKVLGKKKRKAKEEENDDNILVEDDVPIPDVSEKDLEIVLPNYDNRGLAELKARSKKVFDEIKVESDAIFKEIKPHIHGVQYNRDEMDRINKYKKYALEGIESYFLHLKDQFTQEYDKLKKCKKRDKLSKMMNRILKITDTYQNYKEPKEFINFLNRDYKYYFNQIKIQLHEVQKEGNDFPPCFKIVYENLYDIFESLLSYISLNLPNQKNYSEFTQPIISMYNSKTYALPVHYPLKKVIGIWNCRTSEMEEIQYDYSRVQEFQKYSSYQIVNDNDFIYFIGGQLFNPEKNTFTPTCKCFKMSIHSGEIIPLKDMPQAKMKFGIALVNNSIYVFGGLLTIEKHRTSTSEKLDLVTNTWKFLPNMERNRVCPLVSIFAKQNPTLNTNIYLFGGMEDKNNINYSIEIFDQKLEMWIDFIEKPQNSKCYIPKQLGYAIQINYEQILILGGMSGRKQKPTCSMQVYNTSKKSITNLSLDSLPTGILKDGFSGQPIILNKSIYLLNTQISQYFPVLKQLQGVSNIIKIGLNQQEIICTHCF